MVQNTYFRLKALIFSLMRAITLIVLFFLFYFQAGITAQNSDVTEKEYKNEGFYSSGEKYWPGINGNKYTNPDSAFYYLRLLRAHAIGYGDKRLEMAMHLQAGEIYTIKNQPGKALEEFEAYVSGMQKLKLNVNPSHYLQVGNLYYSMKLYENAIEYYKKSLSVKMIDPDQWVTNVAKNNIGLCLRSMGRINEALQSFREVYQTRVIKNKELLVGTYDAFLVGETYSMMGNHEMARKYLYKGISLFDENFPLAGEGDRSCTQFKTDILIELIKINAKEKNKDSIFSIIKHFEEFSKKYNLEKVVATKYPIIAMEWLKLGDIANAQKYLKLYESSTSGYKTVKDLENYAYAKYQIEKAKGNASASNLWKLKYYEFKDSLNLQENLSDILAVNSATLEKQREEMEIQKNKEIEQEKEIIQQERTQRWIAFGLLITAALILIAGVFLYRRIQLNNKIISKQNGEKTLLIREIHHRVKNNLTVITSILDLQQRNIKEENTKQIFRDARARINSMALVHKNLYEQDQFSQINTQTYFENLVKTIELGYLIKGKNITTMVKTHGTELNVDTLVPLALITNELLTNSYKYAFESKQSGSINIELMKNNLDFSFIYTDNGVGFDPTLKNRTGLGSQLIKGLSQQLNGTIEKMKTDEGTKYLILFKGINT